MISNIIIFKHIFMFESFYSKITKKKNKLKTCPCSGQMKLFSAGPAEKQESFQASRLPRTMPGLQREGQSLRG